MSKAVKICEFCGAENKPSAKFCNECGKTLAVSDQPAKPSQASSSKAAQGFGLEIVSLVASILGFTCLPFFGFIIALVTGFMSANPKENKYAKVGIIIGSLGLIVPVIVLGILGIFAGATANTDDLLWMLILGIIGLLAAGVSLFFFIRWLRKPAA